jgi:hypothetical protein
MANQNSKDSSPLAAVTKGLSKEEKQIADEAIAKLRKSFESRLADKVEKMVARERAKSTIEKATAEKRAEILKMREERKALAVKIKKLQSEIREIRNGQQQD